MDNNDSDNNQGATGGVDGGFNPPPVPNIIPLRNDVDCEDLSSDLTGLEESPRMRSAVSVKRKSDVSHVRLNGGNKRSKQRKSISKSASEDEDYIDEKTCQDEPIEGDEGPNTPDNVSGIVAAHVPKCHNVSANKDAVIPIGFKFSKLFDFEGEYYYTGSVVEGPLTRKRDNGELEENLYYVKYDDGDAEDLSVADLHRWGDVYKQHMTIAGSAGLPHCYEDPTPSKRAARDDAIAISGSSDDGDDDDVDKHDDRKRASLPRKHTNPNRQLRTSCDDPIEIDASDDDADVDGSKYAAKHPASTINEKRYPTRENIRTPSEASKEEAARSVSASPAKAKAASPSALESTAKALARKSSPSIVRAEYADAKIDLCRKMGVTSEEAVAVLADMTPPYGLNKAMQLIHKARASSSNKSEEDLNTKFAPHIGMKVRKHFAGQAYNGVVINDGEYVTVDETGETIRMWSVKYEDSDVEDMEHHELLRYRANRPTSTHPSRGRQMFGLELFSGCGAVTQEFVERKWRFRSLDLDPESNATDIVDVMKIKFRDIGGVPDFIWASPPCFTYSNMSAGKHRRAERGEYERTPEAREHNRIFAQTVAIMRWAKGLNPHLIVVIENPVGQLQKMPLMDHFVENFNLKRAMVNYCAFGRDDKKPTYLWTNNFELYSSLQEYKCSRGKCPYYEGRHPISARKEARFFDSAAIPQALAEEVAHCVDSRFYRDRIRFEPKVELNNDQQEQFNRLMNDCE